MRIAQWSVVSCVYSVVALIDFMATDGWGDSPSDQMGWVLSLIFKYAESVDKGSHPANEKAPVSFHEAGASVYPRKSERCLLIWQPACNEREGTHAETEGAENVVADAEADIFEEEERGKEDQQEPTDSHRPVERVFGVGWVSVGGFHGCKGFI